MAESGAGTAARAGERRSQNGSEPRAARGGFGTPSLLRRFFEEVQNRLTADLDDRDPDFIRENLSLSWLIASIWFRGEVRGMEKIPESGPVLLVGNHSGGTITPDTIVFTLAFNTYFGVERRLLPAGPQPGADLAGRARTCGASGRSRPPMRTPGRPSTPARPCSSTRAATGR